MREYSEFVIPKCTIATRRARGASSRGYCAIFSAELARTKVMAVLARREPTTWPGFRARVLPAVRQAPTADILGNQV